MTAEFCACGRRMHAPDHDHPKPTPEDAQQSRARRQQEVIARVYQEYAATHLDTGARVNPEEAEGEVAMGAGLDLDHAIEAALRAEGLA